MARDDRNGRFEAIKETSDQIAERTDLAAQKRMEEYTERYGVTERKATLIDSATVCIASALLFLVRGYVWLLDLILIVAILFSLYTLVKRGIRMVKA